MKMKKNFFYLLVSLSPTLLAMDGDMAAAERGDFEDRCVRVSVYNHGQGREISISVLQDEANFNDGGRYENHAPGSYPGGPCSACLSVHDSFPSDLRRFIRDSSILEISGEAVPQNNVRALDASYLRFDSHPENKLYFKPTGNDGQHNSFPFGVKGEVKISFRVDIGAKRAEEEELSRLRARVRELEAGERIHSWRENITAEPSDSYFTASERASEYGASVGGASESSIASVSTVVHHP